MGWNDVIRLSSACRQAGRCASGGRVRRARPRGWVAGFCLAVAVSTPLPAAAACDREPQVREGGADAIGPFLRERGRQMLSFVGYSGAGYEDPAAMLRQAARVLDRHDPACTVVNIGATAEGIGAVYRLAHGRGFTTIGIVSTLARDGGVALSPCVEFVFFVTDATWGGLLPGSTQLSPTSAAIVAHSAAMVGIGGGEVARDELRAARRAGVPVSFFPADMDHRTAIDRSRQRGTAPPTDFRGAAHEALAGGG